MPRRPQKLTSLESLRVRLGQDAADFLIPDSYRKKDLTLPYGQPKLLPPIGRSQRLLGWTDDYYDPQRGRKNGARGLRQREYDSEEDSMDNVSDISSDDCSSDSSFSDMERETGRKGLHSLRRGMGPRMRHRDTRSHRGHKNSQGTSRHSKQIDNGQRSQWHGRSLVNGGWDG